MVTCRGNKLQTSINFVVEETSYAAPPLWLYAKSPTPFPLYSDRFISPCNSCSLHFCCKLQRHSFTLLPSVYSSPPPSPSNSLFSPYTFAKRALVLARLPRDARCLRFRRVYSRVKLSRCSHSNLDERIYRVFRNLCTPKNREKKVI